MTTLAALLNEAPAATWHVCPRDKLHLSEEQRQLQFLRLIPFVAPGLRVMAIPNAGRRTKWEAHKRRLEGMAAGAPDHVVTWNHGVAFLEWKSGAGVPDANQVDRLSSLAGQGHRVAVVRTADAAFALLKAWGAPVDLKVLEGLR